MLLKNLNVLSVNMGLASPNSPALWPRKCILSVCEFGLNPVLQKVLFQELPTKQTLTKIYTLTKTLEIFFKKTKKEEIKTILRKASFQKIQKKSIMVFQYGVQILRIWVSYSTPAIRYTLWHTVRIFKTEKQNYIY